MQCQVSITHTLLAYVTVISDWIRYPFFLAAISNGIREDKQGPIFNGNEGACTYAYLYGRHRDGN